MEGVRSECLYCLIPFNPNQIICNLECNHILCKPCLELIKGKNFLKCPICEKVIQEEYLKLLLGKNIKKKIDNINTISNRLESYIKTYSDFAIEIKKFQTDSAYFTKVLDAFDSFNNIFKEKSQILKQDPIERLEYFRKTKMQDYNEIEIANMESLLIANFQEAVRIFKEMISVPV